MALKYLSNLFKSRLFQNCLLAWLAVSALVASEHHGVVKFGGLPLPGATVTATQDDKKLEAITDQNGIYSFPELKDGIWTIKVEMLCFKPEVKEVAVAPDAPSPAWDMQLLPVDQIKPVAEAPTAPPAAGAALTTAVAGAPPGTAAAPGTAASGASGATGTAGAAPSINAAVAAANQGGNANGKGKSKKSKKNAQAAPTNTPSGFQRTDLNASAGAASLPGENAAASAPNEFAQSSSNALLVNGSSSNGIESRAIGNARRGPGSMYRGARFPHSITPCWMPPRFRSTARTPLRRITTT